MQSPISAPQLLMVFTLAWRNLWRNPRRTAIMLVAIGVGAWAMIFMTSLLRGMVEDMLHRGIDSLPGHAQIHHPAYLDDPSIVNSIPPPSGELLEKLNQAPINHWYGRLKVPAMISSEREIQSVQLIGFNPEIEREAFANLTMIEGIGIRSTQDTGLVIGAKLASKLETALGRRVVVMSQDPQNELAEKGYRIVGIYQAQSDALEEVFIYSGLEVVQEFLKVGAQLSEIAIFTDHYRHSPMIITALESSVPESMQLKTWQEINVGLTTTASFMDGFVMVWIVVVFLALSFGLINTLIMAVFERVREIGLMLALGMRPSSILLQILFESILLLMIGLSLGTVAALASVNGLHEGIDLSALADVMTQAGVGITLYPALRMDDILLANAVVMVLGIVTSILPAWKAARYNPVKALNTVA